MQAIVQANEEWEYGAAFWVFVVSRKREDRGGRGLLVEGYLTARALPQGQSGMVWTVNINDRW